MPVLAYETQGSLKKPRNRCKYKCIHCGLPVTKVTKKYKPASFEIYKGCWIHSVPVDDGNYYFMCSLYQKGAPHSTCAEPNFGGTAK